MFYHLCIAAWLEAVYQEDQARGILYSREAMRRSVGVTVGRNA